MADVVGPTNWKAFFDAHAPYYDQNVFAQHTIAEIDFLLAMFPIPKGARILDVGCGTGRHSVELARRGFRVTGIDLSSGMLAVAAQKAKEAGVDVQFLELDATHFDLEETFDAAICLCEGGFGLLSAHDDPETHDTRILRCIAAHLESGAPFLLTTLNGFALLRQMQDEHVESGRFDPITMLAEYEDEWRLPEGTRLMRIRERLILPNEVVAMLRAARFRVDHVFGGTAGDWGQRPLKLDEIEVMYICRKT